MSGWELKGGPGTTGRQHKSHERPLKVCAGVFAIQVPGFRLIAMGGWQRIRINIQIVLFIHSDKYVIEWHRNGKFAQVQ